MAGEEYCISAGVFARMCQTTRDTLRYYEKQGILVPKKSEKNGYHYYSYAQISSFYFISTFRGLGCSVEDSKESWSGGSELSEIQENCWNRSGGMIQESRNCMSSRRFFD